MSNKRNSHQSNDGDEPQNRDDFFDVGQVKKYTIVKEGGVNIGGNVNGNVITGDGNTIHVNSGGAGMEDLTLQADKYGLRRKMVKYLSVREIKTITFDLSIDYDRLPGNGVDEKVIALILYCQRRDQEERLVDLCAAENKDIVWRSAD